MYIDTIGVPTYDWGIGEPNLTHVLKRALLSWGLLAKMQPDFAMKDQPAKKSIGPAIKRGKDGLSANEHLWGWEYAKIAR
jgi:hypothetical protein